MRIAAAVGRAHHRPESVDARIYVDGIQIFMAVEADDAEGWVDVLRADDAGNAIISDDGQRIETERLHGIVTIDLSPRKP